MPKQVLTLFFICCILSSCQNDPKGKSDKPFNGDRDFIADIPSAPSPYTGPVKYCFQKTTGDSARLVTALSITVDKDSIYGTIDYLWNQQQPVHAKVGGLSLGTIFNLQVNYKQNGADYTEQVTYKLDNDKLFKKTGENDTTNNIITLRYPASAKFVLDMLKVPCK